MTARLLEAEGLVRHFPVRRGLLQRQVGVVRAVDGVDLALAHGESVALVGESGSGKTTLAHLLMRLLPPTEGAIRLDGEDLLALSGRALRRRRRDFQMVFQDPYSSLNPRMRVGSIVGEPLAVHGLAAGEARRRRVRELLEQVGLAPAFGTRFPHELSGGQRQRVGIARALATNPRLVVADEPVSALDVSVQAQIINLLARLQSDLGLTLLLIAHDLALVEHIADRVEVLYLGTIVESAPAPALFATPQHPYTVTLLDAVPRAEPGRRPRAPARESERDEGGAVPTGCRFHPRCPIARPLCRSLEPVLEPAGAQHRAACHFPGELETAVGKSG